MRGSRCSGAIWRIGRRFLLGSTVPLRRLQSRGLIAEAIPDPTIAPFGDPRQRLLVMSAIPHGQMSRCRPRIDARVIDRVILAVERYMLFFGRALA